jgi:hypothetical protein
VALLGVDPGQHLGPGCSAGVGAVQLPGQRLQLRLGDERVGVAVGGPHPLGHHRGQGVGDPVDRHQQRPGRVESALTQGRQHSSHRTLARPSRSRAAVNTPNKCSTAFSPISASIRTAFLACVSQFTDSQVSTASFCKYERSLAADSAGARAFASSSVPTPTRSRSWLRPCAGEHQEPAKARNHALSNRAQPCIGRAGHQSAPCWQARGVGQPHRGSAP